MEGDSRPYLISSSDVYESKPNKFVPFVSTVCQYELVEK